MKSELFEEYRIIGPISEFNNEYEDAAMEVNKKNTYFKMFKSEISENRECFQICIDNLEHSIRFYTASYDIKRIIRFMKKCIMDGYKLYAREDYTVFDGLNAIDVFKVKLEDLVHEL